MNVSNRANALYLSYDGMCDPLGGSQVLPYLFGLAARGHRIALISFEKPERTAEERAAVSRACTDAGIDWHPLTYHKHPPILSAMYDLRRMRRLAARLYREKHFDLVHCRSYLPALVGLWMKRRFGTAFLFDMRGFWADERLEGGGWKQSNPLFRSVYTYFKRQEGAFWREADSLVSLTEEGRDVICSEVPADGRIAVIPCCVDFDLFRPIDNAGRSAARRLLGIDGDARVLGYIGSLGGNYMLSEMLDFYRQYRERYGAAKFLFVTKVAEAEIRSKAGSKNIPQSEIIVRGASRDEVPKFMAAADEGIAFKQPSFSAKACSPTKLGEMLALELTVIANNGVGDVERVIEESGAGVIVDRFDEQAYLGAIDRLDTLKPDMKRWRTAARRWFDLKAGIDRYDAIYAGLAARRPKSAS